MGGTIQIKKQIKKLRTELQTLIEEEEFERAAETRDRIRSLERDMRQEGGGAE